ncbi:hypothetical protein MANES_15G190025v8 [Manihot esculenta]|uniref:Uncharacterized protein n=1 Tax=Manihot esculenta TaxID=3983 RepID=A0ACB7GCM8_MANES|nr:hypothetical protein MANES_15G190025v8 [Manihot esculenta]
MRVRELLDIRKPLKRTKKVLTKDGCAVQVLFGYERLPTFCYLYGFIGHLEYYYEYLFSTNISAWRGFLA